MSSSRLDRRPQFPKLREIARIEFGQQVFEGLSDSEEPDVGPGCRGQITAQDIAGMGTYGGTIGGLRPPGQGLVPPGLGVGDGVAGPGVPELRPLQRNGPSDVLDHRLHLPRIGFEQELHELQVVPPVFRFGDGGLDEEKVPAGRILPVETHVAGGFLQRRDADAGILQVLGRHVGDLFAGHVGAAELGHRIIAVSDEHAVVEGASPAHGGIVAAGRSRRVKHRGEVGVAEELVQKRASKVLGRAAVAGEERPGYLLRQPQAEDRPVHVGEEWGESVAFARSEVFHGDVRRISLAARKSNQKR